VFRVRPCADKDHRGTRLAGTPHQSASSQGELARSLRRAPHPALVCSEDDRRSTSARAELRRPRSTTDLTSTFCPSRVEPLVLILCRLERRFFGCKNCRPPNWL